QRESVTHANHHTRKTRIRRDRRQGCLSDRRSAKPGALFVLVVATRRPPAVRLDALLRVAVDIGPPAGVAVVPLAAAALQPVESAILGDGFILLPVAVGPQHGDLAPVLGRCVDRFRFCHAVLLVASFRIWTLAAGREMPKG